MSRRSDSMTPAHDLDWTTRQQMLASDPRRSAWVSANAGSGKTHVLSQRVVRLLLSGSRPSAILCLTYTKAAASEMANRVFDRLAGWTRLDDAALAEEIRSLEGTMPDAGRLTFARQLFARALETPGGLKIQTIHAFCEALLHQFPLEANVAGHFEVMDEPETALLLDEVRQRLLSGIAAGHDPASGAALEAILDAVGEAGLDMLLTEITQKRQPIRRFLATADGLGGVETVLRRALRLAADETADTVQRSLWPLPSWPGMDMRAYCAAAEQLPARRPKQIADILAAVAAAENTQRRFELLQDTFLTADGTSRSLQHTVPASMGARLPDAAAWIKAVSDAVIEARQRLSLLESVSLTVAAMQLARRLDAEYEALKRRSGRLDFDDLVSRTAGLLERGGAGPWVHYKLDRGIDHILVDEAQDTSPDQWTVIERLSEEFFAGETARSDTRTLFAVGDEKQSIYSFQGARPELFMHTGRTVRKRAFHAERRFEALNLYLSFRSTSDVLSAVDAVFSTDDNRQGLQSADEAVSHAAFRTGEPGCVDLWKIIGKEGVDDQQDWKAHFDATPESAPPARLARRVAGTIEYWLRSGETIVENGRRRPIRAGDVLVLVRKRDGFIAALMRHLKRAHIAVAGADRLKLTLHIAVEDLMALGRFVLMPEDDLSLCALLKSPLFNFTEQDIYRIGAERDDDQSVFARLRQLADDRGGRWAAARERLTDLIGLADRVPVFEFYARVLARDGGRARFLSRLGNEAGDVLDAFLAYAFDQETSGLPGLQAFLSTLEAQPPEIKREMEQGRNEIRIMTVHSAKGLEAPIVFLVDSGGRPAENQHVPKLHELPLDRSIGAVPPAVLWLAGKGGNNRQAKRLKERHLQAAAEEYRRLLYVGMTRAADRLVVCGYHGLNVPSYRHWHKMVREALGDRADCTEHQFSAASETWPGWRYRVSTDDHLPAREPEMPRVGDELPMPAELKRPLPRPNALPRPLVPSSAGLAIDPGSVSVAGRSPLFDGEAGLRPSMQRGRLLHRLLQLLPDVAASQRRPAAERFVERAVPEWPADMRQDAVGAVLTVLEDEAFAPVFAPGSRAEVSIMGTLDIGGAERALSARLDRVAVGGTRVLIVDYKTNRTPPEDIAGVPVAYLTQMALYRALLTPLYPGKSVETALLFTEVPCLIPLPQDILQTALERLTTK